MIIFLAFLGGCILAEMINDFYIKSLKGHYDWIIEIYERRIHELKNCEHHLVREKVKE